MKYEESFGGFGLLLRAGGKEHLRDRMTEVLGRAKKLQALTCENEWLERRLAAMVQGNRLLQSMRSRKLSNKL